MILNPVLPVGPIAKNGAVSIILNESLGVDIFTICVDNYNPIFIELKIIEQIIYY